MLSRNPYALAFASRPSRTRSYNGAPFRTSLASATSSLLSSGAALLVSSPARRSTHRSSDLLHLVPVESVALSPCLLLSLQGGEKLGYETEAFAIYDYLGRSSSALAAGAKGNRAALPSPTIMIKAGQASDVDLARKEIKNVKKELVALYSKHMGKSLEQIEEDIRRPKYFSPSEAVEYGIIDKVNGKQCGVAPSKDSDTLFLGNISQNMDKEHLKETTEEAMELRILRT
ncbi:hypothetical protein J5N97_025191 [Dioscorea zingiberensis]|uniref:ATP-dependent Clp protease proteolytic subunit n=1 Tax=Dioscorea zingiberensis TaxID=325984 RepID=A0A9D5C894_9LILI|nr:hypothetical protein J5N97_025191 [Dioscorea zingiberensis]